MRRRDNMESRGVCCKKEGKGEGGRRSQGKRKREREAVEERRN